LGETHTADAVANKDSHLLTLDRYVLLREARQDCVLAGRLMDAVSRRVMDLMRNLESCSPKSAQQRIACYLSQRRPHASETRYEVHLPAAKQEVATKLNLTPETFSRVLRHLADEEIIQIEGRLIRVLAADRLASLNPVV
jgi:CRP/FNR family transcriptional regulator, dissimilatory nitrate respiration regulator